MIKHDLYDHKRHTYGCLMAQSHYLNADSSSLEFCRIHMSDFSHKRLKLAISMTYLEITKWTLIPNFPRFSELSVEVLVNKSQIQPATCVAFISVFSCTIALLASLVHKVQYSSLLSWSLFIIIWYTPGYMIDCFALVISYLRSNVIHVLLSTFIDNAWFVQVEWWDGYVQNWLLLK